MLTACIVALCLERHPELLIGLGPPTIQLAVVATLVTQTAKVTCVYSSYRYTCAS